MNVVRGSFGASEVVLPALFASVVCSWLKTFLMLEFAHASEQKEELSPR